MTPEERHEVLRGAREITTAYLNAEDLGDEPWQQLANNFGDRWMQPGLMAVASVAAGVVQAWTSHSGLPRQDLHELTRQGHANVYDPAAMRLLQECQDYVDELLKQPRHQPSLQERSNRLGEQYGVSAIQPLCDISASGLVQLAALTRREPLDVFQQLAIWDEESMLED